jgi:hypothetical protein
MADLEFEAPCFLEQESLIVVIKVIFKFYNSLSITGTKRRNTSMPTQICNGYSTSFPSKFSSYRHKKTILKKIRVTVSDLYDV